jgi:hypothetical protein
MKAVLAIVVSFLLLAPARASADVAIQRFLLVIGANAGGADRAKLQYAISDAERFARVMSELGGVPPANEIVLKQPRLKDVLAALDVLSTRLDAARRSTPAARTEVIVYYSGHADEQGLLLGLDRYAYPELRDRLDRLPADVRIAVLDACASGAFTRLKGGRKRPAFLVDRSANMRGHAFLTSSAATESAQESDRIRASYFTHYLISGFRGAADLSGDGRITLSEAYHFAFNETLGRTVDTRGGAQHPSYDINLSGSGDVVMTDVRQTTATLVLGEDLDGRFFVRNASQELVVELYKPSGRKVQLGLEPGTYEVRLERNKTSMLAKTKIEDGATFALEPKQFGPVALEATRRRGGEGVPLAVAGRSRFAFRIGATYPPFDDYLRSFDLSTTFTSLQFTHYLREDLALTASFSRLGGFRSPLEWENTLFGGNYDLFSVPVGVQWNPFAGRRPSWRLKPFVAASIGPVLGSSSGTTIGYDVIGTPAHSESTFGGHLGGGIDVHLARPVAVGFNAGYNWMGSFLRQVGPLADYSGAEVGVSFQFLFGKGR